MRSPRFLLTASLLAAALAAPGCIIIPKPKPFTLSVPGKELIEIEAAPAIEAALVVSDASPVTSAPAPGAPSPRTDIRGAGDGSMMIETVTVTGAGKDIPHRAPNFSPEQAAAMMCAAQKMGFGGESARRMHEATVKAKQARADLDAGKITLKQADEIELKRQDAVLNYMLPVPILNLIVGPAEKKQDLPKPVYRSVVLDNTDLFTFKENGKEVTAVSGVARNTGTERIELPPLTLRAIDEWGFSIAGQSSLFPFEALEPGEAKAWEVRLLNPPEYTREVYVHFAPPFMYRSPRDCDFFDPATFDASAPLGAPAPAPNLFPPPQVGEGAPVYTASELNQLTLFYRRESEIAWRCQTSTTCAGADSSERLHWRDMFAMAEAIDEAWVAVRAAEEARRVRAGVSAGVVDVVGVVEAAELARQRAVRRFMAMGQKALARAGTSAPDVAVEVTTSEFGRDETGLYVEIAGKVRNTGTIERRVDALMVAFVDRLELPLSSVAVNVDQVLAPGGEQAFSQRLQAGTSGGAGGATARIPPRDIQWQVRVGAMTRGN